MHAITRGNFGLAPSASQATGPLPGHPSGGRSQGSAGYRNDGQAEDTADRSGHPAAATSASAIAHFGSKQDLQLATIEEARQRYVREVSSSTMASRVSAWRNQNSSPWTVSS